MVKNLGATLYDIKCSLRWQLKVVVLMQSVDLRRALNTTKMWPGLRNMSGGCKCHSPPTEEANSAPPNPLAVFEGAFHGGGKRGEKKRDGRITPEINFWLPPWLQVSKHFKLLVQVR